MAAFCDNSEPRRIILVDLNYTNDFYILSGLNNCQEYSWRKRLALTNYVVQLKVKLKLGCVGVAPGHG
jgi:hypothetical protein